MGITPFICDSAAPFLLYKSGISKSESGSWLHLDLDLDPSVFMTKIGASWHLTRKSNFLNKECCDYTLYFFLENVEGPQTREEASTPQKRTSSTTKQ